MDNSPMALFVHANDPMGFSIATSHEVDGKTIRLVRGKINSCIPNMNTIRRCIDLERAYRRAANSVSGWRVFARGLQ
jgi:hypothetical protein